LVLGWICKAADGTITLEGAITHVRSSNAPSLMSLIETLRRSMPPLTDEKEWKRSAAQLPLPLLAGIIELRSNPPLPELVSKRRGKAKNAPSERPLELPPEVAAQLHQVLLGKLRATLDDAIPQFKGKTLRQLASSPKSRPDAISWLREQERILKG